MGFLYLIPDFCVRTTATGLHPDCCIVLGSPPRSTIRPSPSCFVLDNHGKSLDCGVRSFERSDARELEVGDDARFVEGRGNADRHDVAAHANQLGATEPGREYVFAEQILQNLSRIAQLVLDRLCPRHFWQRPRARFACSFDCSIEIAERARWFILQRKKTLCDADHDVGPVDAIGEKAPYPCT